jgi:hypothetical protein
MSLFAVDGTEKRNVPATRATDWTRWRTQLHQFDNAAEGIIRAALNQVFDDAATSGAVVYSSAIPGKDWTDTPYDPIYKMLGDENQARLFFGLIVWDVAVHRPDAWYFKPKDEDEHEAGTYYFPRRN